MLLKEINFAVIDFETTTNINREEIIELCAVLIDGTTILPDSYASFVKPPCNVSWLSTKVTEITDADVQNKRTIYEVFPEFLEYIKNRTLVAQNAVFEKKIYKQTLEDLNINQELPLFIDTLKLSKKLFRKEAKHDLGSLAARYNINYTNRHRSEADCIITANIFLKQLYDLEQSYKITTLIDLLRFIKHGKGGGQVGLDFF